MKTTYQKNSIGRRCLSLLLTLAMFLPMLPTNVFAITPGNMGTTANYIDGTPTITVTGCTVNIKLKWGTALTANRLLTVALMHKYDVENTYGAIEDFNPAKSSFSSTVFERMIDNKTYEATPKDVANTQGVTGDGTLDATLSVDWSTLKSQMDDSEVAGALGVSYNDDGTIPYYIVLYDNGNNQAIFPVNLEAPAGNLIPLPKYVTGWTKDSSGCFYDRKIYIRNPNLGSSITVEKVEVSSSDSNCRFISNPKENTTSSETMIWELNSTEKAKFTIPGGKTSADPLFEVTWSNLQHGFPETIEYTITYDDGLGAKKIEKVTVYLAIPGSTSNRMGYLQVDPKEKTFLNKIDKEKFTLENPTTTGSGTTKEARKVTTKNWFSAEGEKGLADLFEVTGGPYTSGSTTEKKTEYYGKDTGEFYALPTTLAKPKDWTYIYIPYTTTGQGTNANRDGYVSIKVSYNPSDPATILFYTNGVSTDVLTGIPGAANNDKNCYTYTGATPGEDYTLPTPGGVPTGWTFKGWKKDTATPPASGDLGTVTKVEAVAGDTIALYAMWECTITASETPTPPSGVTPAPYGGYVQASGSNKNYQVVKGRKATVRADSGGGYSFVKWAKTAGIDGTDLTPGLSGTTMTFTVNGPVTYTASFKASGVTVTVNKDGSAWGSQSVALYDSTGTLWGTAVNTDTSGNATFTAVPNDTYKIYVGGNDTGETITVDDDNQEPTATLNYYTVQLASSISNGTATVTYDKGGTNNASVTSAGKVILLGDTTTFTLEATPTNSNYIFGWTATAPTDSGGTTSVGAVTDSAKKPATWSLPADYSGKGPITLAPNFSQSGVSATITVNLDTKGTNGLAVSISKNTNAQGTGAQTGTTATIDSDDGKVKFDGLEPSTKYYVTVTTSGYTGVHSFTTPASTDGAATLDYYTLELTTDAGGTLDSSCTANGIYLSGTTLKAKANPNAGYTFAKWEGQTGNASGKAGDTTADHSTGWTITEKTILKATYTPNPITGSDKSINWTYGDSRTETWAPASCAGATVSYALKSGQTFPKWLEASGVMTVDNANGLKIVGRPNKIGTTSIVVVATSDNGADPIELTYTITVGQHNPNITLTDTGNPHYVTDPASGAVTTTFSGPYYTGDPDDEYKSGKWVDLDQDSAAAALTQTYTSNGNSGLTANASPNQSKANVKLDLEVPATGHENKALALSVVWTAVSSNKDVTLSASYNVNVEVKVDAGLDNNGYTDVTISGGSLAAPKTATLSGGKATFTGIPNGATYTVKLGTNGPSESVKVDSGDKTVTFQYWNLKLSSAANGSAAYDSTGTGYVSADGIYYTGTKFKIVATPTPGYSFDQWKALNDTTNLNGNKSATVDTTLTAKTDIQATFTANPVTATITNLAGNYGDDYTTTKKTVVAIGATGVASEAFTFTPKTGNPPLPGGLTLETGTNADGTGYIRVTGRPYEIVSTARSYTYTVTSKNGASKDVTFTVKIDKLSTTITVADNGSAHYKTDPSNGAVTVTVNGNNSTGKPYYDGSDWKSLTGTTILADSSVTYTPNTLTTAPTTSVTVNIGAYEEKTGSPLTDVWSTVSASGDVTVKTSANVTVNVTLNDGNYPAMKGKTVYLKQGTTTVSYGVLGDDTSSPVAKQTTAISKVPTDSTAYDVYIDTVKITDTTVLVNDETAKTVNVAYYTYKFDANKPTDATGAVDLKGAPTTDQTVLSGYSLGIPTTPTLPGYTFKGWSLNDSTSTDGSWDSGSQTINSGARTYYATWAVNPLSLGDGNYSATYGVAIPNGTALAKKPTVTKPDGSDTITYKVGDGAATPTWGSSHTIDGITLTVDTTNGGWTISGTPTQYGTGSVVFDIQVTSTLTKQTKTNKVTVTIAKAQIDTVDVTDIKVPTPGIAVTSIPTADLPTTDPGYGDDTDGKYGDEEATVTWKQGSTTVTTGNFEYGKAYTAEVIVKPDNNHEFASKVTTNATPTGGTKETKTNVSKNADGTVTVTYTFPAIYQLKYSPNGGSGGTQPADQNIKKGDAITIADNPGYTRSGWKGDKYWSYKAAGAKAFDFGASTTVDDTMISNAVDGVITLYYIWESSEMAITPVDLVAVYNMDSTEWQTGSVTYWTRTYKNLKAPGMIDVTGDEVALENLSYALEKIGTTGIDPNTYFKVDVDSTTHIATMSMKSGVNIPAAGTYSFTVKVANSENGQEASTTYTLTVRPIELDHTNLDDLTAPAQGATRVASLDKTDSDATWKGFYGGAADDKVSVSWSPNDATFAKGQTYTATIVLNRKDANYKFVEPDGNSTVTTGFQVGTDTAVKTTTTGEWTYTLADAKVTLTRTYPLTAITVGATLTATAWNTLTVTGFEAQTQSAVNLYYLIYDSAQTFANEAAVKAAYTAATAGSGGVIAKGTQANVASASGKAAWSGAISVTDNGVVGDHTYYLYVLAEAVSDNTVLARNTSNATTPKKLTLTHNGYGKVDWTGNTNIPDGTNKTKTLAANSDKTQNTTNTKVISMFEDGTFTATPDDTGKFGFVKWTLKKATDDDPADVPAGTPATEYKYKASGEGANTNDETLHAIFHRKINGSFTIGITDGAAGAKVYTPSYANSVLIGAVKQAANALPAASATDYSTKGGIKYQWYHGTTGSWTAISGATNLVYTNPANTYAGEAFRLVIYYTDPDNGGIETSVEATTGVQKQKLATPEPVLSKVEHKTTGTDDSFTDQNGNAVDVAKGGLHLAFTKIIQETDSGNPVDYYIVNLKQGTTTVSSVTITAENKDNYYYYWEATGTTGTKIDPTKAYTVEVKAVSKGDGGTGKNDLLDKATNGWLNSDWGKTETAVNAGRRVLTMDDLTVTLADKRFNGAAQTGVTASLANGKVGSGQTKPIGAVTINYAAKADNTAPAPNKTHVNIAENTTPGGTTNDGNHSYYVYIAVAQGDLYLAMANSLYTKTDTDDDRKDTDFEIHQSTSTLNVSDISGAKDGVAVTLDKATVTYLAGDTDIWNTGTGAAAKGNITRYFDLTYQVTASPNNLASDYDLTGNVFLPKVAGDYTIKVTAAYKVGDDADDPTPATIQFQNDIALPQEKTFKVSTTASALNGISAKWDRKADYGDSGSYKTKAGYRDSADTTDYYDASTADDAKDMKLNGLTLVLNWGDGKAAETIILGDATSDRGGVWPGTITASNVGGKAVTVDTDNNLITFPQAGETTLTFSYNGKSASVKYTLVAKTLTYTVTEGEKVWDNKTSVSASDKKMPTVKLDDDQTFVTDTSLGADNVTISATSFAYNNANVGDRTITASGVKLSGDQAGFYTVTATKTGAGKITPRDIVKVTITTQVPKVGDKAESKKVATITGKDSLNLEGLTSTYPLVWQRWVPDDSDPDGGAWVDMAGTEIFANQEVYRPKVTVHANSNHILVLTRDDPAVDYTSDYIIDGKSKGQYGDPEIEPQSPANVEILGGDVAANSGVFYGVPVSLVVTPELRFDDVKNGSSGDKKGPSSNLVRIVSVNLNATNLGSYTIDLGAYVLPVYHTKVNAPNGDLLTSAGATITPNVVQNPGKAPGAVMDPGDKLSTLDGVSSYTLDLSNVDTSKEGTYTMTITARGDKDLGADGSSATNDGTAQATYTFALVVSQAQQVERPQPPADNSVVVLYWVSLKGKTNDLTGEKLSAGGSPTFVPDVIGLDGYVFKGWSETDPTLLKDGEKPTLVDPKTFSIRADKIFYAYYEKEGIDHTHYVVGYKDGTFQPNANITRAEVATIIARACLEGFEEGKDYGNPGNYSDVGAKKWYASAIAYTTMAGVFSGYKDGTFRPNEPITRQEFASVIGRMAGLLVNQGLPFEDASSVSKWARDGVYTVYKHGWVTGYTDNTFQPQGYLTRAEAVRVFNGYLNRGVDAEGLKGMTPYLLDAAAGGYESDGSSQYLTWSDVPERHWAYHDILEASNDHDFHWPDKKDSNEKKDTPPEAWDKVYLDEQWRYRREFAVTFDLAGLGTTMAPTSVKVVENGAIKIAPTVTPVDGYTFLGWSETDPALGEEIVLVAPTAIAITADKTYYAVYEETRTEPKTYNVLFEVGRNGVLNGWPTVTVEENTVPTVSTVTADEGYAFLGWSETDPALGEEVTLVDPAAIAITADKTYYAVYKEVQIEPETYSVLFVAGENGALNEWPLLKVEANTAPAVPAVTANEGYTFLGWVEVDPAKGETVALVDPAAIAITANKTYYAVYEERQPEPEVPGQLYVHKAYFDGREEGRFDPKTAVTRAEVAAMLVRGWATDYDENTVYDVSGLSDIAADHPYRNFIGYCLENGIFSGYKDGTFDPDGSINRQEFASVLARLAGIQTNQGLPFTDADTIKKWARDAIYTVYVNGWMTGYADGTFRPKNEVTRAEAVRAFNNFLGRTLTREGIANVTEFDHIWTDVKVTNWAYLDIMEATHTHTYYILNGVEYWVDATDVDLAAVESDHTEVADEETPEGEPADQGAPEEGTPEEGAPEEGTPEEGSPEGEVPEEGSPEEGTSEEGTSDEESTQD